MRLTALNSVQPLVALTAPAAAPVHLVPGALQARTHFTQRGARLQDISSTARRRTTALAAIKRPQDDEQDEEMPVVRASVFALDALGKELNFFGVFQLRLFYLLALQIGVLREDWLFVVGFLAFLAVARRVQAPDGAALLTAILFTGLFGPVFEGVDFWTSLLGTSELHPWSAAAAGLLGVAAVASLLQQRALSGGSVDRDLLPEEQDLFDIGLRKRVREKNKSDLKGFDSQLNGDKNDDTDGNRRDKR